MQYRQRGAPLGKRISAGLRAISPDDYQGFDVILVKSPQRLHATLFGLKFQTASATQDRTTELNNAPLRHVLPSEQGHLR